MTRQPMTPTLARQLDAIRPLFRNGVGPTYAEIMAATGIASRSGAHRLVRALVACGRATHQPDVARSLRLTDEGADLHQFSDAALLAEVERRGLRR